MSLGDLSVAQIYDLSKLLGIPCSELLETIIRSLED